MKTRSELDLLIGANLLDNVTELITPAKHREVEETLTDSTLNLIDTVGYTAYSGATTYNVGDVVIYQDGLYRAIAVSTGILPTNPSFWLTLSKPFSTQALWGLARAATSAEVSAGTRQDLYVSPSTLAGAGYATDADLTALELEVSDISDRVDLLEAAIPQTLDSVLTAGNTTAQSAIFDSSPSITTIDPNGVISSNGTIAAVVSTTNVAVGDLVSGDGVVMNTTNIEWNEGGVTTTLEVVTPTASRTVAIPDESGILMLNPANTVVVNSIDNLPAAIGGYHTLLDGYTYIFPTDINLGANGLKVGAGTSVTILGWSSETTNISNLGIVEVLLCEGTAAVRWLTLTGQVVIDAAGTDAFDWIGVNISSASPFTIGDCNNFIFKDGVIACPTLISGTLNTAAFETSLFIAPAGSTLLNITGTINRRVRIQNSSLIAGSGMSTLFAVSGTVLDDSFIVKTCNFTLTVLTTLFSGFSIEDDICDFKDNKANLAVVVNSRTIGEFYWEGNALSTGIGTAGTFVEAGTTLTTAIREVRTTIDLNSIVMDSSLGGDYNVVATGTVQSSGGTGKEVGLAIFKNGVLVNGTQVKGYTYATGSGDRIENLATFTTISLVEGDELSIGVTNYTDTTNVVLIDAKLKVNQ